MITLFRIPDLAMILFRINLVAHKFREVKEAGKGNLPLGPSQTELVRDLLTDTYQYCAACGFEKAMSKAVSMQSILLDYSDRYDSSAMSIELENLHTAIIHECYERKFVVSSGELTKYIDMQEPINADVTKAFPSAVADLIEAGNCLALGCNPAVVYHLMRATEVGLWELGRDRRIPLAQAGKIEFSQWGVIIGEIEKSVMDIQRWPNSHAKEDAHKFYNSLLVEIRAFNDGWRRHSAHARPHQPPMQSDEAVALWGHVSRFFMTLALRVGEGNYTPLIWT